MSNNAPFELPETIHEGERNETLYRYACSLWAKEETEDALREKVARANLGRCVPRALSDAEVTSICDGVVRRLPPGRSEGFEASRARGAGASAGKEAPLLERGTTVDDMSISELFAREYADRVKFVTGPDAWYAYDGTRWVPGAWLEAQRLLREFIVRLEDEALRAWGDRDPRLGQIRSYRSARRRVDLLKDVATILNASIADFDADNNLLNLENGTLELRPSVEFREHRAGDLITKVMGCAYDPGAGYGEWAGFLAEAFRGKPDVTPFLKQRMGIALTGANPFECFYMFYGEPRTGKSTALETLRAVFGGTDGGYAVASSPETFSAKHSNPGAPSEHLAAIRGARLCSVSEWPEGVRLNLATLKCITGGDALSARVCHGHAFNFVYRGNLVFNTNFPPGTGEGTVFRSNRAVVIPFDNVVPPERRDAGLKKRLTTPESLSGILNWLIEGLESYEGLPEPYPVPKSCLEAVGSYELEASAVRRFVDECCEVNEGYREEGTRLYASYESYCRESGEVPKSRPLFYRELPGLGFADLGRVTMSGGKRPRHVYEGLRVCKGGE